ncbi:hypothetical protein SPRG_02560 [Saprolegnia parasitica CBS 223.65]|uniref:Uncharacterized protein n=1 Tax=Saprolegnia parasitica (strain CBS 223.65) TaxID=695850 RepID=A0A067D1F8_SAPPC|nr:hypothetical protein SPRG_02560 [Saprolegnia parasitica CBS 223.65]KDO32867.1 hypothetical protein SPRG_02560 [Saprolegnia parasitica CBS 223.65]|eukprot:XP_012196519.1 hypothetical protein SPRG_02560 [Saprolegnia parasitica CBS 223.65]
MLSRMSRRVLARAVRPALVTSVDVDALESTLPTPLRLFAFQPDVIVQKPPALRADGPLERLQVLRIQLHRAFCDEEIQDTIAHASDLSSDGLAALLEPEVALPTGEVRQSYEFDRSAGIPTSSFAHLGQHLYAATNEWALRSEWQHDVRAFHAVAITCAC